MEKFISLLNNDGMKVLIVVIVLDLILGILRAIREKSINSCIGIDGMIRKVGMLIVIVFLTIILTWGIQAIQERNLMKANNFEKDWQV